MLAPPALAAKCAPPGTSGVSQYIETIPGAGCNRTPPQGRSRGTDGTLPRGAAASLTRQGPAGQAVAHLVQTTGTAPRHRPSAKGGATTGRVFGRSLGAVSGQSWLAALLRPVLRGSGSGGLGSLLPIVLGLALLIALLTAAFMQVRTRSRH
jgi:hypothetical protein